MDVQMVNANSTGDHPRGRGFQVLSRLARVEHKPGRRIAESTAPEPFGTVLTLERPTAAPRHRLDIATDFLVSLSG